MADLVKGFTCECGTRNEYPSYVFAHWHDSLVFTCQCGRKFSIISGRASKISNPPKRNKQESSNG